MAQGQFHHNTLPKGYRIHWYEIDSSDQCGSFYDVGRLIINGSTVHEYDLCEGNNTGGYVQGTYDMTAYAGTSPEVRFQAVTDFTLSSNLLVDDVELEVCVPAGATATPTTPQGTPVPALGATGQVGGLLLITLVILLALGSRASAQAGNGVMD